MPITEELRNIADEAGIRLEMLGGVPVWEAQPSYRHQAALFRIQASISCQLAETHCCGCVNVAAVCIQFPDGSQKRPDIAIFCREPDELDEEIKLVPEAVIEILSKGYEGKDLQIGVPFYLSQGVKDVIVFDPYDLTIRHYARAEERRLVSPAEIELQCGCICTI